MEKSSGWFVPAVNLGGIAAMIVFDHASPGPFHESLFIVSGIYFGNLEFLKLVTIVTTAAAGLAVGGIVVDRMRRVDPASYADWSRGVRIKAAVVAWCPTVLCSVRAVIYVFMSVTDCMRQNHWNMVPRDWLGVIFLAFALVLGVTAPAVAGLLHELFIRGVSRPGHCHACGYDLRGNPTARSCPECGALLAEATVSG
jgi:hypothetical protein